MIELYHSSNLAITKIDWSKSKKGKILDAVFI